MSAALDAVGLLLAAAVMYVALAFLTATPAPCDLDRDTAITITDGRDTYLTCDWRGMA